MTRSRFRYLLSVAALAIAAGAGAARGQDGDNVLQPFQMVRSLQLAQDRIADGDHAALPMQKKLLELIDARFRAADSAEFDDRRNFHSLLIYAMSGGNPATILDIVGRIEVAEADRAAVDGVIGYLTGDVATAREKMAEVDTTSYPHELASFLALVKGSVAAGEDSHIGIEQLDRARLLAPGTLVEEAALRRTISLAVSSGNVDRFLQTSEQYARRFLRSPYSSQFAEAFVSGIIELMGDELDLVRVEATVNWMTLEQAKTVYLRLARRAAIDGNPELLAFASEHAQGFADTGLAEGQIRSELYSSISSVTSGNVIDVLARLEQLDPSQLSAADRALLEAAKTVAAEVVAPVPERAMTAAAPTPAQETGGNELMTETDSIVTSARAKLDAIDGLLEETAQ